MKYFILFLLSLVCATATHAQAGKEALKLLATKGANTVTTPGETTSMPLVMGAKIYDNQTLHVIEGGYLSLIHATGKSIELKKAGVYAVKELVSQASQSKTGMASKYANFVIGELTRNDMDINKEHRKNMTVTGSVERSTGAHSLVVSMPRSLVVMRNPLQISLPDSEKNGTFQYTLMNMFEETLQKGEFSGNSMTVTLPEKREVIDQGVLLIIKDASTPIRSSKTININIANEQMKKTIDQEIQQLKTELNEDNAINKLVMASYFEEKRLFFEAEQHIKAAVEMAPDVEAYQMVLRQFYKRNGIE